MPTIKYPKNPNIDTAFVEQEDGTKNRALMIAPQDISTLELPNNPNSTKGYITVDGKKQRVILTADITGGGGGGSALPDQTGHSGEFLTTDGTDASWSDKPLVNKSNMTDSIAIGDNASAGGGTNNILIGSDTYVSSNTYNKPNNNIIIGKSAGAGLSCSNNVIIGNSSFAGSTTTYSIFIGGKCHSASSLGGYSVLLNASTSDQYVKKNCFNVANQNGNFEIMSADGTIPTARLTKVNTTITLAAADWSSNTQTVTVTGMTATGIVLVSPDPTDQSAYTSAGIICSAQAAGTLTFTCSTTPTADLSVNVVML